MPRLRRLRDLCGEGFALMPTRLLRDGILTSEPVCSLTWGAEVLYRRLMSVADDHGRFHSIPKLIRAACYPLQIDKVSDADIGKWLTECVTAALVSVYPASDGKRYLHVEKFGQQVRSRSKFPEPMDCNKQRLQSPASNCLQMQTPVHLVVCEGEGVFEGVISNPNGLEVIATDDPPLVADGKDPTKADRTPIQQIVALYHETLTPACRPCEKVTPARAGYIRQRWRDDLTSLDAWRNYFVYVAQSPFLMGRTPGRDGKPPFRSDIEFLTKPANFAKIAEGKYHQ